MSNIDITQLKQAFERFEEMYFHYQENQSEGLTEQAVEESLVQRFEYCMEVFWKTLRRHLEHNEGLMIEASPKKVIRKAGALNILDTEAWIGFIDARQLTSHDYDPQKLEAVLTYLPSFAEQGQKVLAYLENYESQ